MSNWKKELHDAVANNNEHQLDLILLRPAVQSEIIDINEWQNNEDPLHEAAHKGYDSMLIKMIHCGANIDSLWIYNADKCTALHWAVFSNNISAVKILIQYGANEDLIGTNGKLNIN